MNTVAWTVRCRRRLCRVVLCCALGPAGWCAADSPARWQLAMNDAELRDVVREMSSILGTTVVLDPRVQGRITVISDQALDREGVRRLFYSVLDAHHFTVIDEGERILITPVTEARTRGSQAEHGSATNAQFVTRVLALSHSLAPDLATLLRPLVSVNGYIGPSASSNALVVTDTAGNVRRIAQIVAQLESAPAQGHSIVRLRHGLAEPLARVLEQSLGKQGAEAGNLVIADVDNNRLVLVGNRSTRQRLSRLAHGLDTPALASAEHSRVIRLRHSDARQLAEVLDAMGTAPVLAGNKGATAAPQVMVKADESQNALVLMAEPAQLRTLEQVVRQLDLPRAQVLIHAAIVEVSGDIGNALGVQWGAQTGSVLGSIDFPGTGISLASLTGEPGRRPEGALLHLGSDRFGVLVTALASDARNNVLSTPSLLTLDNQEAEILVGQNVPFKSGSYQTPGSGSENPYTTVTRQDIGIKLKIRPHINDGDTLRLEVEQENSEIAGSVEGLDDLITNKRALKSTILADDGQIIVIGGLIKDSVRSRQGGVPLLRSIPWLGGLFRWSSETREKTNLMIFLRPTIVRSQQALGEAGAARYRQLRELDDAGQGEHRLRLPGQARDLFDGALGVPVNERPERAGARP